MFNVLGKLQDVKQKMADIKNCLDAVTVESETGNGAVKIVATGNRKIKSISISDDLLKQDKKQVEDALLVAINDAVEQADKLNEAEMKGTLKGMLPNIPGLF